MAKTVNDYLKTRGGLKAMLFLFPNVTVDEAVKKIPSFKLQAAGCEPVSLESNVDAWDTLFDMYWMQRV